MKEDQQEQEDANLPAVTTPPVLEAASSAVAVSKEGFGVQESAPVTETAAVAAATSARAQVEARYVMAVKRPRDLDTFRERLMRDAKRPTFASMAEYAKPIGGKTVSGASIRFVESALRHYGNFLAEKEVIYDDKAKRIIRCVVTDLETNAGWPVVEVIEKLVERSQPRRGANGQPEYVGTRYNAQNKVVYIVEATEDDMLNKENARVSKALRNSGLRILPADLIEEALRVCRKTLKDETARDPDAERKRILDAFADLNVPVADLKAFLGYDISQATPAALAELRKVYMAVKDGEVSWRELFDERMAQQEKPSAATGTDKLKESLKK